MAMKPAEPKADMSTGPLDDLPIQNFLTYRLLTLTNRLNRQATKILSREADLRLPEWRCMGLLLANGPISVARMAELSGMDKGLISRSLTSLTDKGVVLTVRPRDDRRTLVASLTKAGKRQAEKILPIMQARQRHLLAALSPDDRDATYRIIDHLHGAIDSWNTQDDSDDVA